MLLLLAQTHTHTCMKNQHCWVSPWHLIAVIHSLLPRRPTACSCRWLQRWVSMPSCLPLELKVWRSHADIKQRICPQAQSPCSQIYTQYCTVGWNMGPRSRFIVPSCPVSFPQYITLSFPPPVSSPHTLTASLSVSPLCVQCDYVTKQNSSIRMFIGGAHLWLVLHNRSLLISAMTYLEHKINTG